MDQPYRQTVSNLLIEANRCMMEMRSLTIRPIHPEHGIAFETVRDCLTVYAQLLLCRMEAPQVAAEFPGLESVIDRLRTDLRAFGQEV